MNHYEMKVFYSREDEGWIATAPELLGCSAFGESPASALDELAVAIKGWLEVSKKKGAAIPQPLSDKDLKGRILLRLPKELHRELLKEAIAQATSPSPSALLSCKSGRVAILARPLGANDAQPPGPSGSWGR